MLLPVIVEVTSTWRRLQELERRTTVDEDRAIQEVEVLPLDEHPDLEDPKVRKVGEGVYYVDTFRYAGIVWYEYLIDLKDDLNGRDWRDTRVTVSMTLSGMYNGSAHWGWPGEPFPKVFHGTVTNDGIFTYLLEDIGGISDISVLAGVFRWIRQGNHGATGRSWLFIPL
jgi:hypothetical protein